MIKTKPIPHETGGGGTSKVTVIWCEPVLCPSLPHTSKHTILNPKGRAKWGLETHIGFPEKHPQPSGTGSGALVWLFALVAGHVQKKRGGGVLRTVGGTDKHRLKSGG